MEMVANVKIAILPFFSAMVIQKMFNQYQICQNLDFAAVVQTDIVTIVIGIILLVILLVVTRFKVVTIHLKLMESLVIQIRL